MQVKIRGTACHGFRQYQRRSCTDPAALAAHQASVRQLEAEGYEVLAIIRQHVHKGIVHAPGDVVIRRSFGAAS